MSLCPACGSDNSTPLPDYVLETHDRDGKEHDKPIRHPNPGRTRQEHRCEDCGACFVGPPSENEAKAMRAAGKAVR